MLSITDVNTAAAPQNVTKPDFSTAGHTKQVLTTQVTAQNRLLQGVKAEGSSFLWKSRTLQG
jgi:hypothetical protein